MTAGLDTFAKVRALHDRTANPGGKAAAAGRREAPGYRRRRRPEASRRICYEG